MTRRLFVLASALSLALCVASIALWVRSVWRSDEWTITHEAFVSGTLVTRALYIDLSRGYLWAEYRGDETDEPTEIERYEPTPSFTLVSSGNLPEPPEIVGSLLRDGTHLFGVHFYLLPTSPPPGYVSHISVAHGMIIIPMAWCVAITAVPPAVLAVGRLKARRRTTTGRCRRCGYDLRASPERCPECGAIAQTVRFTRP